jgi:hypothetical protein
MGNPLGIQKNRKFQLGPYCIVASSLAQPILWLTLVLRTTSPNLILLSTPSSIAIHRELPSIAPAPPLDLNRPVPRLHLPNLVATRHAAHPTGGLPQAPSASSSSQCRPRRRIGTVSSAGAFLSCLLLVPC